MVQIGPQRRMRKIDAKAPKGASPFPEILSYTPRKPRNSASLTPPWSGAVSGRKGMVGPGGVGLTNEINGLGRPTPSNLGIDFKRQSTRLSNPISAGYRRVLRSKKFIQAEEQKKRGHPIPDALFSALALWQVAIAPNGLPCSRGCDTRTSTRRCLRPVEYTTRRCLRPVEYTDLRNPASRR